MSPQSSLDQNDTDLKHITMSFFKGLVSHREMQDQLRNNFTENELNIQEIELEEFVEAYRSLHQDEERKIVDEKGEEIFKEGTNNSGGSLNFDEWCKNEINAFT